jgi:glycosyltransferase involved in cell wall biosynthesis
LKKLSSNLKNPLHNKIDLSVVVPLYNEAESITELHNEICQICQTEKIAFEVIYVDDGSLDQSFAVLKSIYEKDKRVRVIQFRKNFGKAEALSAGFGAARAEIVVTMDADLQDDPAEIPKLIRKLNEGFDLVSGWKKRRKDPLFKKISSRLYNVVAGLITGLRLHDMNCGLKIYRKPVVESIYIYGDMHRYIPALAKLEGFEVGEMPVHHRPRKYGKTKYGLSRIPHGLLDLITVMFLGRYTRRPLHLFGFIGFFSTLLGSGITIYLIVLRLTKTVYLSNRPLLFIGVLLLIIGIQFISIGLIGEMITRRQAADHKHGIRQTLGA